MPNDQAAWSELEHAYVETDETIANISNRLGVSVSTIHRRASLYGWPRRKGRSGQTTQVSGIVTVGSLEAARNDVIKRLYRCMSQKLTKMEQDASTDGGDPSAADPDDRMLTSLIRQFEKLTGLHGLAERERTSGTSRAGDGSRKDTKRADVRSPQTAVVDAAELRRQIVERLESLHRERGDRPPHK